jgi:hypothetical protein
MSNTLCNEWNLNRNINPITKRKPEGVIYKNLLKKCDKNKVKKTEKIIKDDKPKKLKKLLKMINLKR